AASASGPVAGCGGGGCHEVTQSPWAYYLGIPVAWLGMGVYLVLALASVMSARQPRRIGGVLALAAALMAIGAASWFVAVQAMIVGRFCRLCLSIHGSGVLAAALTVLLL